MTNNDRCIKCQRPLTKDEIGLHKKAVDRTATEFMCLTCLSEHFKMSEEDLNRWIEKLKKQGCLLFR